LKEKLEVCRKEIDALKKGIEPLKSNVVEDEKPEIVKDAIIPEKKQIPKRLRTY
jgi:hypothetical protein